jgi:aminoglycoside phosphotransferase (APT) family kinase protein
MQEDLENMEPFADIDLDSLSEKLINYIRKELNQKSVDYREPLTRLTGGYETLICRFELKGVEKRLARPLVLRVFQERDSHQAHLESTVQNALADQAYPVPAVHLTCMDESVLGNAFMIMDYVEGETLEKANLPLDQLVGILGKAHALLHCIDPGPILEKVTKSQVDARSINYEGRLERLLTSVNMNFPWLETALEWLYENRPDNPDVLSICHGDFHPMNILFKEGKIQAVLDWPNFLIGDPAMDVAFTLALFSPAKLIFPDLDLAQIKDMYLKAYGETRQLDETNIAYYSAAKSIQALRDGAEGQDIWRHPVVVQQLLVSIYDTTGIKVKVPS